MQELPMPGPVFYQYRGSGHDVVEIAEEALLVEQQRARRREAQAWAQKQRRDAARAAETPEQRAARLAWEAELWAARMASQPAPLYGGREGLARAVAEVESREKRPRKRAVARAARCAE